MIAQTVASTALIVVEYGAQYSGVRSVAQATSTGEVSELLAGITWARAGLCAIVSSGISGGSWIVLGSGDPLFLQLIVSQLLLLGGALQPTWFFQGLQRFALLSVVQMFSRLLCYATILLYVRNESDILLAQFFLSLPFILNALILMPIALASTRVSSVLNARTQLETAVNFLRSGADIFAGQLGTILFSGSTTLAVGVFAGNASAGYYSLGERLVRGVAMLAGPVCESLFPRVSSVLSDVGLEKLEQTRRLLKRVLYASGICLFVTALTLYLAAPEIARLLSSSPAGQVKLELTVQSLSLVPLLIFLNNFFGTVYLVATGQARLYRNAIAVSALFLPCCLLTVPRFVGFVGYPLSLLLAESLLATLAVLWGAGALNSSVIRKEHEVS